MSRLRTLNFLASVALPALMLLPSGALAQTAQDAADAGVEPIAEEGGGDVIVVIGTAGAGMRRQDAAFAVTTISDDAIKQIAPSSTADLFKIIPGVSAESSGGQNGANIFVRGFPSGGDAEFVTIQQQGVPFFPPSTLSFLENSQLIRIDETFDRVEAVRGGTGALFGSGQPGLTVNFVQKTGGSEFEGLGKVEVTDFGDIRGDAYVSGPIGPDTSFMVGGFYREGDGIRDAGFTAERGGQISANIEHRFDRGKLLVFGRYLDDFGQWLLPIPVIQDGDDISEFPGFDAGTGTLAGPETRRGTLNDGTSIDLADGRGAQVVNFGLNFDYELTDNIQIRERASYLNGDADTNGLVPAGPPQTAASFAAGLGGTIGSLTFASTGAAADPNQQVIQSGLWRVQKDIDAFVNDLSLQFTFGTNTLTGGFYYSSYSSKDDWNLGNGLLLTAEENARRLDLVLADGRTATRDGFVQGSFFNVNADYDGEDIAFYLVDEWQITPDLRIDGGIRWQETSVDGVLENNTFGVDTDNNPNTLFNNGTAVLNGTFQTIEFEGDEVSFTVGANYDFSDSVGVFARYSQGHIFPFFDNLREGLDQTRKVDSIEGGVKISTDVVRLYGTVFYNEFEGLSTFRIVGGDRVEAIGGAETFGVELEGAVGPFEGFTIGFSGTYLDATFQDFFASGVDLTGNRVQRQPEWQARISPVYEHDFGDFDVAVFTSLEFIGDRFSDPENQQLLPSYTEWDAGISVEFNDRIRVQVTGDNLTNEIGLTEGNPRLIGSQGSGVILARPILGRSFRASTSIRF
ncbi:TonB-dependent receptor [Allopontixanthobacter sp.]|uniref:TonB-dependent receptor n=1 Tax=Allopontixanthobacter sp. TaxID=2906452 RepID=UPI002ABBAD2C|nr:TonB-dependent receptor [Allopontixanthobacter sp.]MDZ4308726.1 TonB-dependent receptor [Allopontixanthobacter sp.]